MKNNHLVSENINFYNQDNLIIIQNNINNSFKKIKKTMEISNEFITIFNFINSHILNFINDVGKFVERIKELEKNEILQVYKNKINEISHQSKKNIPYIK